MRDRPHRYVAWAAVAVGVASGMVAASQSGLSPNQRAYNALMNPIYWTLWALLVPLAVWTAGSIRVRRWPWGVTIAAHVAAGVVFAVAHVTALYAADKVIGAQVLGVSRGPRSLLAWLARTPRHEWEWELTMYGAMVALAYASALGSELRIRAVTQARLESSLAEARLLSLQRQLQPHFLFNTLHAVTSLMRKDPDAAEHTIDRLSRLLRTTFRSGPAAEVTLAAELDTLQDYVAIEQVQMRERLSVTFAIDPETLDAAVPVLLVQPLVENAIRHGLQPRARGGRVHVTAALRDGQLVLTIEDDGVGLAAADAADRRDTGGRTGVGLSNTFDRLTQLYGDRQSLRVVESPKGGVTVEVQLPFRVAQAA